MSMIISVCDHSGAWSRPYLPGARVARVDPKHGSVDQGGRGLTVTGRTGSKVRLMADGGEGWPVTVGELVRMIREGEVQMPRVDGLLLAPPCTDFAVSGNQWWAAKDADGRTSESVQIVHDCLDLVELLQPRFWVLENPAGRIGKLVPRLVEMQNLRSTRGLLLPKARMTFHPHHFAGWADDPQKEAYTKLTCLWGVYNKELERSELPPVMYEHIDKYGKTKRGSMMWAKSGGKSEKTKELRSVTPTGFSRAFAKANPV